MIQNIITYTIVAAAVAFFVWRMVRRKKGNAGCSCCSNCDSCTCCCDKK
ncbi:MAG: FeoB-associated Cys-rich membrane protein [Bacteroidales bacterium]|nr:FeoB-associated Cys-rich membrane protein [Bacteroidales bacterium]